MAYNTGNAIGSADARDIYDNAQNLDKAMNSTDPTWIDRFGVARPTFKGAESELNQKVDDAEAAATEARGYLNTMRATSYGPLAEDPTTDPLGNPCTAGDEYFNTTYNLLKRFDGSIWRVPDINTENLASGSGSSLVGHGGQTVEAALNERLPEIGNYAGLDAYNGDATAVLVYGVANIFDGGAGVFRRTTDTPAAANGIYRKDALNRWWKREIGDGIYPEWFGAMGGGVIDDAVPVSDAFVAASAHKLKVILRKMYGIGSLITISSNFVNIEGDGAFGYSGFKLLAPGAGIQIGTGANIYMCRMANVSINGNGIAAKMLKMLNVGEFSIEHLMLTSSAAGGIGVEFDGPITGLSPIHGFYCNTVSNPVVLKNGASQLWFTGANIYNSDTVFTVNGDVRNIVVRDSWLETFNTGVLFDSSAAPLDVFGFRFRDTYFQNTNGGAGKTSRIAKVVSTNEAYRNRVFGFSVKGGGIYASASKYFVEVLWNGNSGVGTSRFYGEIDDVTDTSPAGVTAWFNTDATVSIDAKFVDFKFGRKNRSVNVIPPIEPSKKWNYNREKLTVNSATPSVYNQSDLYVTANTTPTTITDFIGGVVGNPIKIHIKDTNTTFKFVAGTSWLRGNSGVDYVAAINDLITAEYDGDIWHCSISKA